jgi:aspartate 1-decarboxylase
MQLPVLKRKALNLCHAGTVLKSKIHRAVITEANPNYAGSLTLDEDLMEAANLVESEKI